MYLNISEEAPWRERCENCVLTGENRSVGTAFPIRDKYGNCVPNRSHTN